MKILSIESSCDETAAAVIEDGRKIISSVINTQVAEHGLYGGVVPEIASRRHTENIVGVVEQALADAEMSLSDVDYIAVTTAPGLIGALLVGVSFAKGLSLATGKPLIARMATEIGIEANIADASTRSIEGRVYGSMLLSIEDKNDDLARAIAYLTQDSDVTAQEVTQYAG